MSQSHLSADDITLPVKRTTGETLEDRMTANAYHNILPARYLQRDAEGTLVEEQEDLFDRVAKNIALAEAVYEAKRRDVDVMVTPDQLKPDHPRRNELAEEVFGDGVTVDDDEETLLTERNVNKFAYDTIVPALPAEIREHVEGLADEFQELMERLSFVPNSPTLMNAGGELQQLSACFVMSPDDDITDIHETATKAAEVFQCLTEDTRVAVESKGLVSIADVKPGDRVIQRTTDGHQATHVSSTFAYDNAPVKCVKTECGIDITGTPNHKLHVDGSWRQIQDIDPGDRITFRLGWLRDLDLSPELDTVEAGPLWHTRRTVSNEDITELHAAGLNDYEIAEVLDSSPSNIQHRRANELGLPPNGTGGRPRGRAFDEDRFISLYEEGHTDGEIAAQLGASKSAIRSYRIGRSLEPNGTPAKSVIQPTQLTAELAELLGLWIGDGSFHQDGIRFHISNEQVLEQIDRLSRDIFDTGVDWTWAKGAYEVVIHSQEIRRWWLHNFGEAKPSSADAVVPSIIWEADHELAGAFLRGLFTADGTLTRDKSNPRLYSASRELIEAAHQLLIGLGIPAKFWEWDNDERDYYSVAPVGESGIRRYADLVGFIDDRQEALERSLEETEFRGTRTGTLVDELTWEIEVLEVEDAGKATVYDLNVPNNHEYLANSIVSHNSGGGVGYGFWKLRPYGDSVGSTGGIASGPITFMRTYDQLCETIAQGGTRRGAQMAIMRVSHPDVIEFIHAKNKDVSLAHCLKLNDPDDYTYTTFSEALEEARELIDGEGRVPKHLRNAVEGHLSNFNISVGVTDGFMEALKEGEEYTFTNPRTGEAHVATPETKEMYSRYDLGDYVKVGEELSLPAEIIWERIIAGAHENGEPGVVFLERINKEHSFDVDNHPEHQILATNPCGEQPLEEFEACNLGHINLSTLAAEDAPDWRVWSAEHADAYENREEAIEAFLSEAIDWDEFDYRIDLATRFLENVVTMSDFPVPEIEETVRRMRKIGLGIMGLAQMYIQLGMQYGSEESNEVARQLMVHINHGSKWTSHELAEERGVFAEWEDSKYADPVRYREWFEHQTGLDAEEWAEGFPIRNHNTTTIAPTGTTGMVGNTTGGCEPIYNVAYYKNVSDDVQGDEMLVEFDDYFLRVLEANDIDVEAVQADALKQMSENRFAGIEGLETVPDAIGELFVTTSDITAKEHAAVQCACQAGVDSAISKTVNAPNDSTLDDAKEVFEYIYDHGGKGVTYYRDGTRSKQVLTTRADNADFADMETDEAAAMLIDQIEDVFGSIEGFLDDETVQVEIADSVETIIRDADHERYAKKRPRPDVLHGTTQRIETGYGKLYVNINEDEDGRPFELFATIGNSGGFTASFTEALAKTISTALRAGVDPAEIAGELQGIRSPKVAWDKGEQINSIPDAVGTALRRYLNDEIDKIRPEQSTLEQAAAERPAKPAIDDNLDVIDTGESPECPDCGSYSLYFAEGCKTCDVCGWSEC